TKNKEEYRRAIVVKQKMEGQSFRTIAKNLTVNYRNVYYMIKSNRSFAPALLSGVITNLWLYWSATFVGTYVIAYIFKRKLNNTEGRK
ncbi:MAG: hypothetical protein WA667_07340, partial [Candidatus Nitrosopolaris sp.]